MDEIDKAVAAVRDFIVENVRPDILKEAAIVCDKQAERFEALGLSRHKDGARCCANAIWALANQPTPSQTAT